MLRCNRYGTTGNVTHCVVQAVSAVLARHACNRKISLLPLTPLENCRLVILYILSPRPNIRVFMKLLPAYMHLCRRHLIKFSSTQVLKITHSILFLFWIFHVTKIWRRDTTYTSTLVKSSWKIKKEKYNFSRYSEISNWMYFQKLKVCFYLILWYKLIIYNTY